MSTVFQAINPHNISSCLLLISHPAQTESRANHLRKPIQAKCLPPLIRALLYLAMGVFIGHSHSRWLVVPPLLFFLLFITDFPISFVALGVPIYER